MGRIWRSAQLWGKGTLRNSDSSAGPVGPAQAAGLFTGRWTRIWTSAVISRPASTYLFHVGDRGGLVGLLSIFKHSDVIVNCSSPSCHLHQELASLKPSLSFVIWQIGNYVCQIITLYTVHGVTGQLYLNEAGKKKNSQIRWLLLYQGIGFQYVFWGTGVCVWGGGWAGHNST